MAFSALLSCTIPMMALRITISRIRSGSKNSDVSCPLHATIKETTAAAIRISIITSLNCSKKRCRFVFFFLARSWLGPYSRRRSSARVLVSPSVRLLCNPLTTASNDSLYCVISFSSSLFQGTGRHMHGLLNNGYDLLHGKKLFP